MKTATQDSYAQLKEHLASWKGNSNAPQADKSAREYFALVAQETLLPELQKLAHILEKGGLECEVFAGDEDTVEVGIRVETLHAVLRLLPADRPTCIRAIIAGGQRPNDDLEWFIPYHQIHNGGLERELQSVMLQLLKRSR
ncbi:MAG TPA: hypothetical protein PLZ37_00775 [Nitrospira sp.]|nr:hypothetical protein [Nitrospira sp.]